MTVEVASFINQLNPALPAAGDARSEGDDHLRLTKTVLQAQFTNLGAAAVTVTAGQINVLAKSPYAVLLGVASAANVAAIDFTTGIDGTYEEYELHIIEAVPATNGANPWLRTSTDGGSTFAATGGDYFWQNGRSKGTTSTVTNGGNDAKLVLTDAAVFSTASSGGVSGVVRFFNPAGTAASKRFIWMLGSAEDTGSTTMTMTTGMGARTATADIDAIRFMFSTGNITSGKFKLYGVSKA